MVWYGIKKEKGKKRSADEDDVYEDEDEKDRRLRDRQCNEPEPVRSNIYTPSRYYLIKD